MKDQAATDPKTARIVFGSIGGLVVAVSLAGGALVGLVVALALLGTPLFAILGGASELAWLTSKDPDQQVLRRLASEVFGSRFGGSPILTTIPLFTFVGYAMAESKTPERLVRAATAWVGWMPGGLAIVCVMASAVFTLFTGGSGVTIIAVGGLLLPALRKKGYSESFSLGLVTTGGSLGLLLPYALPLLVYAMVTGLDFQLVNKAVLLPGALVLLLLAGYSAYRGVKEGIPRTAFDLKEALRATWDFKWEIGVFVVLVVSIKGIDQTAIDKAAGIVALYTLVIEFFVYKDLSIKKDLVRVSKASMALAGAVIAILAMATAFVNYVDQVHLPQKALDAMLAWGLDKQWQFLIVMNVFLLVLGMVMDGLSAILIAVPIVLPFAARFGLNPFHVAIMFVLNLELAFSAPPLGLNLFISSFRFTKPVVGLYRVVMPFVGLLALGLLIITYVPSLSFQLVKSDIADWRKRAEGEHRAPTEAWFLECVQLDRNNPQPCTEEDKKKYPNGQMPAPVEPDTTTAKDAGAPSASGEDDDLEALISGKEAGAPKAEAGAGGGSDSEDDLLDAIKGGGGKADGGGAANKPAPKPGQESDDDLLDAIKGGGKK
jgi:tripartite ATP-independent transporter DctM subunit